MHLNLEYPQYTCLHPGCEAVFGNVEALDTHVNSHFNHEDPDITYRNHQSTIANIGFGALPLGVTYRLDQFKPYECSKCGLAFKRLSDAERHGQKHNPNAHRFGCQVEGCPYKGKKGFLRKDKLMDHVRCRHWQLSLGKNEQGGQRGDLEKQT